MRKVFFLILGIVIVEVSIAQTQSQVLSFKELMAITENKDVKLVSSVLSKFGFELESCDTIMQLSINNYVLRFVRIPANETDPTKKELIILDGNKRQRFWKLQYSSSIADLESKYITQTKEFKFLPINCPPNRPGNDNIYKCLQNSSRTITFVKSHVGVVEVQYILIHPEIVL